MTAILTGQAGGRHRRGQRGDRVRHVNLQVAVCRPQEGETVALIRGVIAQALATFGVTDACIDDIRLALSEACTNVVQHAAAEDEYEVHVQVDDQRCAISVTNTKNGFDAAALAGVMPDVTCARGRGVAIMHAVVDSVDFTSEPETGTIVRLVKALTTRDDGALARLRRPAAQPGGEGGERPRPA